jgi:hypothetical protein
MRPSTTNERETVSMDATQAWDLGRVAPQAGRPPTSAVRAHIAPRRPTRLAQAVLAIVLMALALALTSPAAFAGDYTVSMGEVFGCMNHSWSHSASMSLYNSYDLFCTGSSVDNIAAAVNQSGGRSNGYDNAQSNFTAPAGTWISHADLSWSDGVDLNHNFGVGLRYEDGAGGWHNFATCWPNSSCTLAAEAVQSTWPGTSYDFAPGTQELGSLAVCLASWCDHTPENGQWAQAYVEIHSAQVTLHEDATPSISYLGGGLTSGTWVRGVQGVGFNSSDYTGIRRAQLWIDGNRNSPVADTGDRSCDYTYTVPCSNISGGALNFDTSTIGNGVHTFRVSTENAAGNWTDTGPTNFYVDNGSPGEVQSPSVEGGQGWHTTNSFAIDWTNPSDVAPITTAYYEICDQAGQNCQQGNQTGQGINKLTGLMVPAAGTYKVRVWVGDAAGNASGAKSPFMTLAYDGTIPGPGVPVHNNGWVNASQAKGYQQEVDPPTGTGLPPSGIAGYAVTTDGSEPATAVTLRADPAQQYKGFYTFDDLPEGDTTVKARAISGAGIASTQVGSTVIQVDKTPPVLAVSGIRDPNDWSRTPVSVAIAATDALSGMTAAPSGDPDPTHGAYIDYSVDGGADTKVAGGAATAPVASDGTHVVTYQAFDVAGNGSAQRSVYLRIDQTPPVAGFEAQDASDPSKISVVASDATSGLADGGVIELRPVGAGSWTKLPTTHDGSHYYAHVDPSTLAPGAYDLQALVPDEAGNVVTTSSRASDGGANSGGPEQIVIDGCRINGFLDQQCVAQSGTPGGNGSNGGGPGGPGTGSGGTGPYTVIDNLYQFELGPDGRPYDYGATVGTFLDAGIVTATKRPRSATSCARNTHKTRGKRKKGCRRAAPVATALVSTTRLKFGQGATVHGDVTFGDHTPLGDVDVLVLQRYDAAGMRYTLLRAITTNRFGRFTYNVPGGASRTIAFLYRGSSIYRHSTASVDVHVPAAATLNANKTAVRNGQSVTFRGTLLGGPYPKPGKLVALQAFYRGRWRTFATARANDRGGWRYTYRFGATHGVVVYRFRAQIRQEAAYPYLLGYSRNVAVRVSG